MSQLTHKIACIWPPFVFNLFVGPLCGCPITDDHDEKDEIQLLTPIINVNLMIEFFRVDMSTSEL